MDQQMKRYDHYSQLLWYFSQNMVNLDYFEKRVKKYSVPFEFVNIKNVGIEQTQNSIMNIQLNQKHWEQTVVDAFPNQNDHKIANKDDIKSIVNSQNASELMLDYTGNPLKHRQLNLLPSHSDIHFSFIHLPFQNVRY